MALRPNEHRLVAASFAGSVALHAAALAVAPLAQPVPALSPVRVLSVLLVAAAPVEEQPPARAAPPPPPRRAPPMAQPRPRAVPTPAPEPASARAPAPEAPPLSPSPPPAAPEPPAPREPPAVAVAPAAAPAAPATPPDFRAAYLRNPPPAYPASARRRGEEGTVTLRVLVSADGRPDRIELERSSGSKALDLAALHGVREWRFAPALRGGTPYAAWVLVPVIFRLDPDA